jgi:hypothetical protein
MALLSETNGQNKVTDEDIRIKTSRREVYGMNIMEDFLRRKKRLHSLHSPTHGPN